MSWALVTPLQVASLQPRATRTLHTLGVISTLNVEESIWRELIRRGWKPLSPLGETGWVLKAVIPKKLSVPNLVKRYIT